MRHYPNTRFSILSFLLLLSTSLLAVPAKRGQWVTITLKNGQTVRAEARGDESAHYWLSADGRRYVVDELTGEYSETDLEALTTRRTARRLLRQTHAKRRATATRATSSQLPGSAGNYLGQKKGLVILVEFSNAEFSMDDPQALYHRICNEEGFSEQDFRGSVADYFKAQSDGLFELSFDVVGPVKLSQPYGYYGRNDDANTPVMIHDACLAVDPEVNFADYDWNGDGEAEEVFVVYAGYGESDNTSQTSLIWPHMYWLSAYEGYANSPLILDGTLIETYACANELKADDKVNGIGTFCHEFSHCLGIPDLYDTGDFGAAFGMSSWSLMDFGCYNGDGYLPSGYTGYEKMCVGWMEPVELSTDTVITGMRPVSEGGQSYLLRHPDNGRELLVIDNRQLTGYDAALPGHGLLVTQIVYDQEAWAHNEVNLSENDYERWTIYHADNTDTPYDQEGDPFPYYKRDSLTVNSTPALLFHTPTASGSYATPYSLTHITEDGDGLMSFTLTVRENAADNPVFPKDVLFMENFDRCAGTGGNDGLFSGNIASGKFTPDVSGWQCTVGAYGADQCARFGKSKTDLKEVRVSTPPIYFNTDSATLTFRAAGWNATADGTTLLLRLANTSSVKFADGTQEQALTMKRGEWTTYTLKIVVNGWADLYFLPSKRFFLDDVLITAPVATGIDKPTAPVRMQSAPAAVYSLDGRQLGTTLEGLPKGIYIQGGKKIVK